MKTLVLAALLFALPAEAGPYAAWAAVVASGDSYSDENTRTAVFDNGRIGVVKALTGIGFKPENIRQFSDWRKQFPEGAPQVSTPRAIARGLGDVAAKAKGGCLVYLTSHGDDKGIGVGDYLLSPKGLAKIVDHACPARPAVVIVSACYSGVFVPKLKRPDRIVLTAAAPDRSSFGCGAADKYTFFDECVLQSFGRSADFPALGKAAMACVAAREKKEDVDQPSNPQLAVGEKAGVIPKWK